METKPSSPAVMFSGPVFDVLQHIFSRNMLLTGRSISKSIKRKLEGIDGVVLNLSRLGVYSVNAKFLNNFSGENIVVIIRHGLNPQHSWLASIREACNHGLKLKKILLVTDDYGLSCLSQQPCLSSARQRSYFSISRRLSFVGSEQSSNRENTFLKQISRRLSLPSLAWGSEADRPMQGRNSSNHAGIFLPLELQLCLSSGSESAGRPDRLMQIFEQINACSVHLMAIDFRSGLHNKTRPRLNFAPFVAQCRVINVESAQP